MGVVPANKLLLQENQLIGIDLLTSNFLEIVVIPNFQRGPNARFDPEGGADPANKVRWTISVIFVGQVSLQVILHNTFCHKTIMDDKIDWYCKCCFPNCAQSCMVTKVNSQVLEQCFPNCVPLKKLKCAAKVLYFDKTLYFLSQLRLFVSKYVCRSQIQNVLVCRNIKKFEKCCPNPNPVVANLWHVCQRWHSSPSLWAHTP